MMKLRAVTIPIIAAGAFALGVFVADQQPQKLQPPSQGYKGAVTASADTLSDLIAAAERLGYSATVAPATLGGIDLRFEKMAQDKRGIFSASWQRRETITLKYLAVPEAGGLVLADSKKEVEEKPPIGSWKTIQKDNEVPADLWAKTLKPVER